MSATCLLDFVRLHGQKTGRAKVNHHTPSHTKSPPSRGRAAINGQQIAGDNARKTPPAEDSHVRWRQRPAAPCARPGPPAATAVKPAPARPGPSRNAFSHSAALTGSATRCQLGGAVSQPSNSPDQASSASCFFNSAARSARRRQCDKAQIPQRAAAPPRDQRRVLAAEQQRVNPRVRLRFTPAFM